MKITETKYGTTPNGGVKSVSYYFDKNRNACNPNDAQYVNIVEYDENDNRVFETYGIIDTHSKKK